MLKIIEIEKQFFWINPKNGNKWDFSFSKSEAIKADISLENCKNCLNCQNCSCCIDCKRCLNCLYCEYCKLCKDCQFCKFETDLENIAGNGFNFIG